MAHRSNRSEINFTLRVFHIAYVLVSLLVTVFRKLLILILQPLNTFAARN